MMYLTISRYRDIIRHKIKQENGGLRNERDYEESSRDSQKNGGRLQSENEFSPPASMGGRENGEQQDDRDNQKIQTMD